MSSALRSDPWVDPGTVQTAQSPVEAWIGAISLVALGSVVLIGGWLLDVVALRGVLPGLATMKPVTAACFLLSGVSAALVTRRPGGKLALPVGAGAAALTVAVGALAVVDYRLAWAGGWLEGLLTAGGVGVAHPLQMSEATGWGFIVGGSALWGLWVGLPRVWVQSLGLVLATLAATTLSAYVYNVGALYAVGPFHSVALHTALGFLVLAFSVLASEHGLVALWRSGTAGGQMARRLLPLAVVLPFGLGWAAVVGIRRGALDPQFVPAAMAAAATVVLGGLVWRYAGGLDQAEAERARLTEQVQRHAHLEAVGRVAGRVAHDFNNYLTVIGGTALLALEEVRSETVERELTTIIEANERAAELTAQLLTFSRGRITQRTTSSLNEVLKRDEPILSRLVPPNVSFRLNRCVEPTPVNLSASHVGQILTNLIVNACDAMPDGGTLTVETRCVTLEDAYRDEFVEVPPGRYLLLAVSDTGHGMDRSTRAQVFEPFFTTKDEGQGTGLGLATVYGIVLQAGGLIGLYSEEGVGTTFKVFLPLASAPSSRSSLPAEVNGTERGGETVLVVDDDPVIRLTVGRSLQREGYRVLEAHDGSAALRTLEVSAPVDLVLSDVMMPGMTGVELAREIRRVAPDTRIVLLSGYAEEAATDGVKLPAYIEFIEKPFDPKELRRRLRAVLNTSAPGGSGVVDGGAQS